MGKSIQNVREKLERYTDIMRKSKLKHGFDAVWDNLTYFILEYHSYVDMSLNNLILRRYFEDRESPKAIAVKIDILSRLDFYKKIELVEQLNKDFKLEIPIDKIRAINNLRNALVHDFPKDHRYFQYNGGHIISDGKLDKLLADFISMLDILDATEKKFLITWS